MHNPTLEKDIHRILASMDSNGKDAPKNMQPLEEKEEPEEFDVYIEPDRITVVKRPEPQAQVIDSATPVQPEPTHYFAIFTCFISLLLIVYLVTSAIITTFFPPTVTITLLTKSQTISATGTLQLQARIIPPITLSESQTVQTTGRGHQDARSANGYITFYNGEFQSITIPAGKALTGNSGNIAAYDINSPCCFASVIAKNPEQFTGGQDERDFQIVTQKDITGSASSLKTNLAQSMQAALQSQQKQGEALSILPCSPQVTTDHQPGDEASTVHVTVSETCQGYAYSKASYLAQAATILSRRVVKELGAGYTAIGNIQLTQTSIRVTKNIVTLAFTTQAVFGYALTRQAQSHIKHL